MHPARSRSVRWSLDGRPRWHELAEYVCRALRDTSMLRPRKSPRAFPLEDAGACSVAPYQRLREKMPIRVAVTRGCHRTYPVSQPISLKFIVEAAPSLHLSAWCLVGE
jgi:hypothetical protein